MAGVLKIRNPGTGKFEDIPSIVGPSGKGFPAGGATGQVLKKASDNDYDAEWSDAAIGSVTSVNGKTPDASGAVTLEAADIGYGDSDVGSSLSQLKDDMVTVAATEETPGDAPEINAGTFGGMTVAQFVDKIYPRGSIYMSVSSTSPETLFGGKWKSIGGRFLLGADATYTAGSTGGEATHALTVGEMPKHDHQTTVATTKINGEYGSNSATGIDANTIWSTSMNIVSQSGVVSSPSGGGQPHNNMPPYLAVYMWQRTA